MSEPATELRPIANQGKSIVQTWKSGESISVGDQQGKEARDKTCAGKIICLGKMRRWSLSVRVGRGMCDLLEQRKQRK